MPGQLVGAAAALAFVFAPAPARADDLAAGLRACRGEASDGRRLACYDALDAKRLLASFAGAGSGTTAAFDVAGPSLLRFESLDVIMVVYLLGADGQVVQNLHRGGAGTGSFLIEEAGVYRVQVDASGGWRISVEEP